MNAILADLFRHNLWANLALIDVCADLPDEALETIAPGTFGSVRATLAHLAGAEERYVSGLIGGPERRNPTLEERGLDLADMRRHLQESGDALIAYAETVSGDPTLTVSWHGEQYQMPASLFLVQAIDHATEHRTQIKSALTIAGHEPPEIDGWTWDATRRRTDG